MASTVSRSALSLCNSSCSCNFWLCTAPLFTGLRTPWSQASRTDHARSSKNPPLSHMRGTHRTILPNHSLLSNLKPFEIIEEWLTVDIIALRPPMEGSFSTGKRKAWLSTAKQRQGQGTKDLKKFTTDSLVQDVKKFVHLTNMFNLLCILHATEGDYGLQHP